MLELGVVEESHSDWCSPVVLVGKPDGSVRFCVDYRRVNAVSKFDAYPMPRIDELVDRLGMATYYTTLDCTKGYWQIPLSPAAREKTAFSTPLGLYQFKVLPFGLFGAPATFQRLMDRVLRPHAAYAAAYPRRHSHLWRRVGAAYAAGGGGPSVAETGGAHGQPEEVRDRAEGDPVSGVPPGGGEGPAAGR